MEQSTDGRERKGAHTGNREKACRVGSRERARAAGGWIHSSSKQARLTWWHQQAMAADDDTDTSLCWVPESRLVEPPVG